MPAITLTVPDESVDAVAAVLKALLDSLMASKASPMPSMETPAAEPEKQDGGAKPKRKPSARKAKK